ncbi:MAG: tyrosine-type recombinase/integrase, partial [Oscillospiraceae bacterium]
KPAKGWDLLLLPTEKQQESYPHTRAVCDETAASAEGAAGRAWEDSGLVFTNEFGRYVSYRAIFDSFKRIVKRIGLPDARIHDLRHTYAVNCIRAGDDIKTVQSNLGHATAAFTLDVYGHFTDDMRSVSAQRMEGFITNVLNL